MQVEILAVNVELKPVVEQNSIVIKIARPEIETETRFLVDHTRIWLFLTLHTDFVDFSDLRRQKYPPNERKRDKIWFQLLDSVIVSLYLYEYIVLIIYVLLSVNRTAYWHSGRPIGCVSIFVRPVSVER